MLGLGPELLLVPAGNPGVLGNPGPVVSPVSSPGPAVRNVVLARALLLLLVMPLAPGVGLCRKMSEGRTLIRAGKSTE